MGKRRSPFNDDLNASVDELRRLAEELEIPPPDQAPASGTTQVEPSSASRSVARAEAVDAQAALPSPPVSAQTGERRWTVAAAMEPLPPLAPPPARPGAGAVIRPAPTPSAPSATRRGVLLRTALSIAVLLAVITAAILVLLLGHHG